MITFLSKFLPLFLYPLGLVSLLLLSVIVLWKKQRLVKTLIIAALVVLVLGGNRYIASAVARSLEWRFPSPGLTLAPDAIVILGGGTEPAISPRQSIEVNAAGDRVIYGAILARQFPQSKVIVSGGDIDFLDIAPSTPAQDMASLLELMGIARERILLQANSQNTFEDAQLTCKLIKDNKYSQVFLVTSAMHMPRSMMMFTKAGCAMTPLRRITPLLKPPGSTYGTPMLKNSSSTWSRRIPTCPPSPNPLKSILGLLITPCSLLVNDWRSYEKNPSSYCPSAATEFM